MPEKLDHFPPRSKRWEIYVFNEIEVEEYLAHKIELFSYFDTDGWLEAFEMVILEATSYGGVCVPPRHFETALAEAAITQGHIRHSALFPDCGTRMGRPISNKIPWRSWSTNACRRLISVA